MSVRTLVKKVIPSGLFPAIEPYGHLAEAVVFNTVNGFPAKGMKVIGVTGTNGKTSTTFLIHRMLHEAGYKVGLMSTVAYGVGDDIKPQIHHMTNVGVPELMQRLKWMKGQGVEWLVLETTSHALAQNRVWGVPYRIAVLTNLTHEHLDYHKTFENYREAKAKLFRRVAANKEAGSARWGIINGDDPSADYFVQASGGINVFRYSTEGKEHGQIYATDVVSTSEGSDFTVNIESGGQFKVHVNVPGSFNVANALAAASVGVAVGLKPEQISAGIAAMKGVEGRMTTIEEGQDYSVIVDFAHTPDSFEKLFKDLRPVVKGKLIVMFGSAGRRDETKRGVQGHLAGRYADIVVVTEEDDRDVDGQGIMEQIAEGAVNEGKVRDKDLFLVHDRTEAINYAISLARPGQGDTVLLLGKGHEKTIERANGENPWDEIGTARNAVHEAEAHRQ